VLASALPVFLILISLESTWVPFLIRFFLLPAVLAAPLLARLFRGRATTAAYLAVAAITLGLTITHDQPKPLQGAYGRPWNLTQLTALDTNSAAYAADALAAYDELVPARACVGAVLGTNEPSYLLFGPRLQHRVDFLSVYGAAATAQRAGLTYVVVSNADSTRWVAEGDPGSFKSVGWRIRPLGDFWFLASTPHAGTGACGG
jgi:hypothetical protein